MAHVPGPALALHSGGLADYAPGETFGPRRLRDHELVWLVHGSARWTRGRTRIDLTPGHLLLLPPGPRDHFAWAPREPTRHGYAHFTVGDPALAARIGAEPLVRPMHGPAPLAGLADYLAQLTAGRLAPEDARTGRRADRVLALLLDLLLDEPMSDPDAPPPLPAPIAAAAARVAAAWAAAGPGPVSLERLAAAADLSGRQLTRVFARSLGIGPVTAFELVRLDRGARLLARGATVASAARACGFTTPFHFSRRFRAEYGLPPRDWRPGAVPDPLAERGLGELARAVARPAVGR